MIRILLLLVSLMLVAFVGSACDNIQPDFSRAVFVEASPNTGEIDTIKIAVNPDKTASMQATGRSGGGYQGTWQPQESTDMARVLIRSSGGNVLLTFYQNKEAGISVDRFQFFGRWYQE
ncbi:MAG: hypothetical protein HYX92_18110 [Chloroflexi bacterium]|nr:hypothetical protein [Chloroflexota bacterium]